MSCFSGMLASNAGFASLLRASEKNMLPAGVTGLSYLNKVHLIHSLCEESKARAIIITGDEGEAVKIKEDLNTLFASEDTLLYPARDFSLSSTAGQSREYEHLRLGVLGRMLEGDYKAVVCSIEAAMQFTIPPDVLLSRSFVIEQGMDISIEKAREILVNAGYSPCEMVEGSGQFAVRGGILDFYPPDAPNPIRAEFWGDSIDTMGYFEIVSQRRTENVDKIKITPSVEVLTGDGLKLSEKIEKLAASLRGKAVKARQALNRDAEMLRSGLKPASTDKYIPLIYENTSTVLNYADDALLFVSDTAKVKERGNAAQTLLLEDIKDFLESGELCRGLDRFALTWAEMKDEYEQRGAIYLDTFARGSFDTPIKTLINMDGRTLAPWGGDYSLLKEDIVPALQSGWCVAVMAGTEKAAQALCEMLSEDGIPAAAYSEYPSSFLKKSVNVLSGGLSGGLEYPAEKFMLISRGRASLLKPKQISRKKRSKEGFNSLDELHRGDYIVHSVHGIGIFDGITKLEVGGVTKDYIKIKYAKEDVLFVPVTQLDLVSKYVGPGEEGRAVKINKLGTQEWKKTRTRVRSAVKDMAKELIKLYAARQNAPGYAFMPDTDMQNDFERRFAYDETDDQLRSIYEIKHDMEKKCPMDRLLCGDVGFGKTEVALRAAFKCIAEGKQCAMLVPTTVLAFQHYQTIIKRFEGFPVEVEMISRFRTAKQQEQIIKGLKRGSIDMIVGTHRLISKDIEFKDLGLVIVDEEQRFGVAQKEKLKERFPNVDVLTLSATPIPRTLNMAMSGIRDMSMLEEAPQDRHPVQTYVIEHDMGIIAQALEKELRRGGQAYYLHNRVDTIERTAAKIQELLPEARIGIAHGKMTEEALSTVWKNLLEGEIDILVCTTIIETGVDVPNANTLIVENADRLGLAQLHQIRGRVGRSARRASAYLTFTRGKELSDVATRRLTAIREYTEFGSGFKIAMRDLEIRGAGNILGAQQHGHMEAVGYDLYLKMLARAVSEEKGEVSDKEPEQECLIDIQIQAHIPDDYIESVPQRLAAYRRIADIRNPDDADDVVDEFIDRYGDPPPCVEGLIRVALLRNTAISQGIYEIGQKGDCVLLYSENINMKKVSVLGKEMKGRILVGAGKKPYISVKSSEDMPPVEALAKALSIMSSVKE